jgi:Tfp pilus assembly protein PilN
MTLKEEFENSLLIRICVVFAAGAALAWAVSQNIQVNPRERDITALKQRIVELEKTISDLNAMHEPG